MKGKIKLFKADRGFGFIKTNDGDYFFHISTARSAGLNDIQLIEGAEFEIEVGKDEKGKTSVTKFVTNTTSNRQQNQIRTPRSEPTSSNTNFLNYSGSDRNFYLFLNKPYHVKEHDKMYDKKGNGESGFALSNRFPKEDNFKVLTDFSFSGINCSTITSNQKANVEALFPHSKECKFKPDWRLTLGLGGASIFETDITLHHIYGVPYIPASSIKGVVRSYIIEEEFNNDEASAIMNKDFCDIFGCSKKHLIHKKEWTKPIEVESFYGKNTPKKGDRKGQITFFDALPINSKDIHISMDIMNVHYKDYYGAPKKDGKYEEGDVKPPADWSSPNIINFLTVKNTTFQFLLASKDTSFEVLKIKDKTIDQWLTAALENQGIGAKTAVGYGYMQ